MSGYTYCAHEYCFAIVIGFGDRILCDDCAAEAPDAAHCDCCDNDSKPETLRDRSGAIHSVPHTGPAMFD